MTRLTAAGETSGSVTGANPYFDELASKFDEVMDKADEELTAAIDALGTGDSSSPKALATYQKAMIKFQTHVGAQSQLFKTMRDVDQNIIHNS